MLKVSYFLKCVLGFRVMRYCDYSYRHSRIFKLFHLVCAIGGYACRETVLVSGHASARVRVVRVPSGSGLGPARHLRSARVAAVSTDRVGRRRAKL